MITPEQVINFALNWLPAVMIVALVVLVTYRYIHDMYKED